MPTTVDDEGFGDFVFAPNLPIPSGRGGAQIDFNGGFNDTTLKMASVVNNDEDWSDFVTPSSHGPSAAVFNSITTFQSTGFSNLHPSPSVPSALSSIGFDPFRLQIGNMTQSSIESPAMISVASDPQKASLCSLHPSLSLPSALSSIGDDPFDFLNGNSAQPAYDSPAPLERKKVDFENSRGPLPLSIFGGDIDEGEEKEGRDGSGGDSGAGRIAYGILNHEQSEIAGNENNLIPPTRINDILASLYSQSRPIKSDKGSSNNSTLNSNMLGSHSKSDLSLSGDDKGSDIEDDWDFKSATSAESNSKDSSDVSGTKLASQVVSNRELRIGMDESITVDNGPGWKAAGTQLTGLFSVEHEASIANGQIDFAKDISSPSIILSGLTPFPPSGSVDNDDKNQLKAAEVDLIDDEFGEFMDASLDGGPEHQEDATGLENNVQPSVAALSSNGLVQSGNSRENDVDRTSSNSENDGSSQVSVHSIRDLIAKLYEQSEQVISADYSKPQIEDEQCMTLGLSSTADETGLNLRDEVVIEKKPFGQSIVAPKIPVTSTDLQIYLDFYTGLKKELCFLVSYLLDNAEKAQDAENVKENSKFQEVRKVLQDNMNSEEACPEKNLPQKICCDELLEVLHQPMFVVLESEYSLSRRLHLAEMDLNMAVELLKEACLSIKVLTLGTVENQYAYVYTWATVVDACAQVLRHGAYIWRRAIEKNLHTQILSDPRGRRYIQSLGEIYKVALIMGTSAKSYKLWILLVSKQDQLSFFPLFDECVTLWSSSGLELAHQNLMTVADSGSYYDADVEALHNSIQNTVDTNVLELFDCAFLQQRSFCQLSLLPREKLPELKMVSWNGENYFLKVANLWGNLISQEPPSLAHLQVG